MRATRALRAAARGASRKLRPRHGGGRGGRPGQHGGRRVHADFYFGSHNVRSTSLWSLPRVACCHPWRWLVPAAEDLAAAGLGGGARGRVVATATWWPAADSPDFGPGVARRAAEIRAIALARTEMQTAVEEALQFVQDNNENTRDSDDLESPKGLAHAVFNFALFHAGRERPAIVCDQLRRTLENGIELSSRTFSVAMAAIVASPDSSVRRDRRLQVLRDNSEGITEAKWKHFTREKGMFDFAQGDLLRRLEPAEQVRMSMIGDVFNLRLGMSSDLNWRIADWLPVFHLLSRDPNVKTKEFIRFYHSNLKASLLPDVLEELENGLSRRRSQNVRDVTYWLVHTIERVEEIGDGSTFTSDRATEMTPIQCATVLSRSYCTALRILSNYNPSALPGRWHLFSMLKSLDDCASKSRYLPLLAAENKQLLGPADHKYGEIHKIPLPVLRELLHAYTRARDLLYLHPGARDRARQLTHAVLEHPNLNVQATDVAQNLQTFAWYPGNRTEVAAKLDSWLAFYPQVMATDSVDILEGVMKVIANAAKQEGKRCVLFSFHGLEAGDTAVPTNDCDTIYEAAHVWYARLKNASESGESGRHKSRIYMLQTLLCLGRWEEAEKFIESDLGGTRNTEIYEAVLYFHGLYTGNRELAIKIIAEMESKGVPIRRGTLASFATVFLGVRDDLYVGAGFTGLGAPSNVVKECVGHVLDLCGKYDTGMPQTLAQRLAQNTQRCGLEHEYERIRMYAQGGNLRHVGSIPPYDPSDVE